MESGQPWECLLKTLVLVMRQKLFPCLTVSNHIDQYKKIISEIAKILSFFLSKHSFNMYYVPILRDVAFFNA